MVPGFFADPLKIFELSKIVHGKYLLFSDWKCCKIGPQNFFLEKLKF